MASAQPATSCSSRLAKDLVCSPDSNFSTSESLSLEPSMRVDDPTLSIVAIRRRLVSFSGARVSMTFQRPLNSSIAAMSLRISGVIVMLLVSYMGNIHLHPFFSHSLADGKKISIHTHLYPFSIQFVIQADWPKSNPLPSLKRSGPEQGMANSAPGTLIWKPCCARKNGARDHRKGSFAAAGDGGVDFNWLRAVCTLCQRAGYFLVSIGSEGSE